MDKEERFRNFSVADCSDFTELTKFMEFTVDKMMELNEELGYKIKREDFVQLLKKLAREEINFKEYYCILEEAK